MISGSCFHFAAVLDADPFDAICHLLFFYINFISALETIHAMEHSVNYAAYSH